MRAPQRNSARDVHPCPKCDLHRLQVHSAPNVICIDCRYTQPPPGGHQILLLSKWQLHCLISKRMVIYGSPRLTALMRSWIHISLDVCGSRFGRLHIGISIFLVAFHVEGQFWGLNRHLQKPEVQNDRAGLDTSLSKEHKPARSHRCLGNWWRYCNSKTGQNG